MKTVLAILIGIFFVTNSYATSPILLRGVAIKVINDSSFTNDRTYFSFETDCPGMASCVVVRVERGNASEDQLKEVKKIFYLALTLKKRVEYTSIGSDRVDITQPITLLGVQ